MKLYEMIKALRVKGRIEVRDVNGNELFTSNVTSEILNSPYLFFHVAEWFPGHAPFKDADFTVYIADDFEAKERIGDCTKCEKQKSCFLGNAKVRVFCEEYEKDEQREEGTEDGRDTDE